MFSASSTSVSILSPGRLRSFHVIARNLLAILFALCIGASAQTADEMIAKNIAARGGLEKLKAIQSSRVTSTIDQGGFRATIIQDNKRPNMLRTNFIVQGMAATTAYDGSTGWRISPFQGRKDPELIGEDELKAIAENS